MAKMNPNALNDGVSVKNAPKAPKDTATTVCIMLPLLEEGDTDAKVDQTATVVVNGVVTQIKRGEYVDVKVPVFLQLKNKYPNL